jgi:hypothetical protein
MFNANRIIAFLLLVFDAFASRSVLGGVRVLADEFLAENNARARTFLIQ